MPLLKHAKKKLRQEKKRAILNKKVKNNFKAVVKKAKETKDEKALSAAFKGIDKAVKKNIIHKNKAARMKSSLSKMVGGKTKATPSATAAKTPSAKPAARTTKKPAAKPTKTAASGGKKSSSKKK